jgi:hypothetical protein
MELTHGEGYPHQYHIHTRPPLPAGWCCGVARRRRCLSRCPAPRWPLAPALIGMCTEFRECERRYGTIYDDPARVTTDDEAEVLGAPVLERMKWLSPAIMGSRAHTVDGIVAYRDGARGAQRRGGLLY